MYGVRSTHVDVDKGYGVRSTCRSFGPLCAARRLHSHAPLNLDTTPYGVQIPVGGLSTSAIQKGTASTNTVVAISKSRVRITPGNAFWQHVYGMWIMADNKGNHARSDSGKVWVKTSNK